eukprot:m.56258 g.56258  ORF g.56258 m.56258 type:complete len:58 (+) comp11027_c0_seq1:1262-1435(+)
MLFAAPPTQFLTEQKQGVCRVDDVYEELTSRVVSVEGELLLLEKEPSTLRHETLSTP